MQETIKNKIYVALSGGVDSAVAAALLVKAGYDVTGVYMKNWADNFGISADCPWEKDVEDVRQVAEHLGIPWKVYNFEKEYNERILDFFFSEYKAGRTPNPDILCNNLIKFDLFAKKAFSEGATHIATGHYARRQSEQGFSWENHGKLGLYTALDATKDQGYFLQRLSSMQLERALFPLGNYYKSEVRTLAMSFTLPNAQKKDSQGICFIGDIDVRDFIRTHLNTNPGEIVDDETGKVVGKHEGLWFYTIGQRQGIKISSNTAPYFVVEKNVQRNQLRIAKGHENSRLFKSSVSVSGLHAISEDFCEGQEVLTSLRYREKPMNAIIEKIVNGSALLVSQMDKQFWAPAEGQGVILYKKQELSKFVEIANKSESSEVLYNYFTNSETRVSKRSIEILGAATITA